MNSQTIRPTVPKTWLAEFEAGADARRIEQLAADLDLVSEMRLYGFRGPLWEKVAEILGGYGYQVLKSWVSQDLIFEKVARKGFGRFYGGVPRVEIPLSEVDDLVVPTLTSALEHFRAEVLVPGVWDPRKRASLKTFFVGQCLMRFPSIYRSWYRQQRNWGSERRGWRRRHDEDGSNAETRFYQHEVVQPRSSDPSAGLLVHEELDIAVSGVKDKTLVSIFGYRAAGFEDEEIAEILEMSVSAIKSRVYRHNQRAMKERK